MHSSNTILKLVLIVICSYSVSCHFTIGKRRLSDRKLAHDAIEGQIKDMLRQRYHLQKALEAMKRCASPQCYLGITQHLQASIKKDTALVQDDNRNKDATGDSDISGIDKVTGLNDAVGDKEMTLVKENDDSSIEFQRDGKKYEGVDCRSLDCSKLFRRMVGRQFDSRKESTDNADYSEYNGKFTK